MAIGINAKYLKSFGFSYLRFNRGCYILASEAGNFYSDVFGINDTESIELEVKISKSDLMNDFKKPKHGIYKSLPKENIDNIPNYFYYLIPYSLQLDAESLCSGTPYGIILSDTDRLTQGKYSVCKQARRIHNNLPNERLKKTILLRMASELANYHINFEKIIQHIDAGFKDTMGYLSNLDKLVFKEEEQKSTITLLDKEVIESKNAVENIDSLRGFLSQIPNPKDQGL